MNAATKSAAKFLRSRIRAVRAELAQVLQVTTLVGFGGGPYWDTKATALEKDIASLEAKLAAVSS